LLNAKGGNPIPVRGGRNCASASQTATESRTESVTAMRLNWPRFDRWASITVCIAWPLDLSDKISGVSNQLVINLKDRRLPDRYYGLRSNFTAVVFSWGGSLGGREFFPEFVESRALEDGAGVGIGVEVVRTITKRGAALQERAGAAHVAGGDGDNGLE